MKFPNARKKTALFSVFFTYAVDNLGATIVFPIFAPLFLRANSPLFTPETPLALKTTLLGVFLAAFPLAQFFLTPLFGDYSEDEVPNGRKS